MSDNNGYNDLSFFDNAEEQLKNIMSGKSIKPNSNEIKTKLIETNDHVILLIKDLEKIYNAIVDLKKKCMETETTAVTNQQMFDSQLAEFAEQIKNNEDKTNDLISNLNLTTTQKSSLQSALDEQQTVYEKEISLLKSDISRCAEEKSQIIDELTKIDTQIVQQSSLGKNGFYDKLKDKLNLEGGFNWRTAVETKKLMSSKSSDKILREKNNYTKRKSSRSSQHTKSKKKKKGIFRNLGLFRKK